MTKRQLYFIVQKLIGVALIVGSVLFVMLNDGDATAALITVPLGLYSVFTKRMIWRIESLMDEEDFKEFNGDEEF